MKIKRLFAIFAVLAVMGMCSCEKVKKAETVTTSDTLESEETTVNEEFEEDVTTVTTKENKNPEIPDIIAETTDETTEKITESDKGEESESEEVTTKSETDYTESDTENEEIIDTEEEEELRLTEENEVTELECRELKEKLEVAYSSLKNDGVDFDDNIEQYFRNSGIASEQISRIQSLTFDVETGKVTYLTISDSEVPYCDAENYTQNDRYYYFDNDGISDLEQIDEAINVENYVSDMAGSYAVYIGSTDEFTSYRIREDMSSEQVLIVLAEAMPYLENLSDIINDDFENSDMYRFNLYELWWYIPSSVGRAMQAG